MERTSGRNFYVPVYWMVSEDHDFEEINHFSVNGRHSLVKGTAIPVGVCQPRVWVRFWRFGNSIWVIVPMRKNFKTYLRKAILRIPIWQMRLALLVHQLFGRYGLLILDGDNPKLKQEFIPYLNENVRSN